MKRLLLITGCCLLVLAFAACVNDDTDFSAIINQEPTPETPEEVNDTISIVYSGNTATVTNDRRNCVTATGAHVIVSDALSTDDLVLVLSGTTDNGSLLVFRSLKYEIVLNGLQMTNPTGAALNNQCHKMLTITCIDGTENNLTDGTAYTLQEYDEKGTLFSEGQITFRGTGTLNIFGNYKNGIATDDYLTIDADGPTIGISVAENGTNGLKANDGVFIHGGVLTIDVTANGARGIKNDGRTEINGGITTITTSGDCNIETVDGVTDTTSCACIKSDSLFTMTAGTLIMSSSGDGGKGISCGENIELSGGTLVAKTTGSNNVAKPKAVKSETGIILSGGSFTATVRKSWACDNGTDSEEPEDHITIVGTPQTIKIAKKSVVVEF